MRPELAGRFIGPGEVGRTLLTQNFRLSLEPVVKRMFASASASFVEVVRAQSNFVLQHRLWLGHRKPISAHRHHPPQLHDKAIAHDGQYSATITQECERLKLNEEGIQRRAFRSPPYSLSQITASNSTQ